MNHVPTRAILRAVAHSYSDCIRSGNSTDPIDLALARAQHRAYRDALTELGLETTVLEADDRFPDCCYIEDPVMVVSDLAIFAPMQAESRRGEDEALRPVLGGVKTKHDLVAPATLDGGDVVRIGKRLFVGITERTNSHAVEQLRALLGGHTVVPVDVSGMLHLKSGCSCIGDDCVLLAPDYVDARPFVGMDITEVPREESYATNCLVVGDGVLVSAGYPRTQALLDQHGLRTIPLNMSEFRKGGGSLTCLSVLF